MYSSHQYYPFQQMIFSIHNLQIIPLVQFDDFIQCYLLRISHGNCQMFATCTDCHVDVLVQVITVIDARCGYSERCQ